MRGVNEISSYLQGSRSARNAAGIDIFIIFLYPIIIITDTRLNPMRKPTLSRRAFVTRTALTVGAAAFANPTAFAAEAGERTRPKIPAAIIGHTGRGDYGHGLDQVFTDRDNIEVVAVADPVAAGRAKVAAKARALRQYDDYRVMLEKEKPRLVCIAPRWSDQHHAMALAAFRAGAHVFIEKPITQTLVEADGLLAKAEKAGLKIGIAFQMRLAPSILHLKKMIEQGLIGDLLQIHAYGKQDNRAGGEDMLVLGTHLFDLVRFFAGDASWCTARVLQNGYEITRQDAHTVKEDIGPIAGDDVEAQFGCAGGVIASFTSRAKLQQTVGHWGIELIGSKGAARILADIFPSVFVMKATPWEASGKSDRWERMENDPTLNATVTERTTETANKRVIDDWLEAIDKDRMPVCSGHAAMKSLEMIMAVYQAALSRRRVALPLSARAHPLKTSGQ
jgi:predicted dehydrogenase